MSYEIKIGQFQIKTENKEQANLLIQSILNKKIDRKSQCFIFVNKDNPKDRIVVELDSNSKYLTFFQTDNDFRFICDIDKSQGLKILEKSVSTYKETKDEKRLISIEKARKVRNDKIKKITTFINEFESHIPDKIVKRLKTLLIKIDSTRITYKCEIYENIFKCGYPNEEQWNALLNYFEDNILASNESKTMTYYELRKAFMTCISKIFNVITNTKNDDVRSIVKLSRKTVVSSNYWDKYNES